MSTNAVSLNMSAIHHEHNGLALIRLDILSKGLGVRPFEHLGFLWFGRLTIAN